MFSDITLAYDEGDCLYAYRTNHSATRTLFVRICKISPNLHPLNSLQGIKLVVKFYKSVSFLPSTLTRVTAFGLAKFSLEIVFY